MGSRFEKALEDNPVPRSLGDTQLLYDTTVWSGRAKREARSPRGTLALIVAAAASVGAVVSLVFHMETSTSIGALLVAVAAWVVTLVWEQQERAQRAFVFEFFSHILRLDFSTRIRGMPRTLRVPFASVVSIDWAADSSGSTLVTVDFEVDQHRYREVLIAGVSSTQVAAAQKYVNTLRAALGDGKTPQPADQEAESAGLDVVDKFG